MAFLDSDEQFDRSHSAAKLSLISHTKGSRRMLESQRQAR